MLPVSYTLPIQQYSYLSLPILLTDDAGTMIDLTGFTARMQARTQYGQLLLDLTQENGGIVLDASTGSITIVITATQSSDIKLNSANYDLILTPPSGNGYAILSGKIQLNRGVTHA